MQAINISKNLIQQAKDGLVIIARKEYENLLFIAKKAAHYKQLDEDLNVAMREVKEGKTVGPFSNTSALIKSLRS